MMNHRLSITSTASEGGRRWSLSKLREGKSPMLRRTSVPSIVPSLRHYPSEPPASSSSTKFPPEVESVSSPDPLSEPRASPKQAHGYDRVLVEELEIRLRDFFLDLIQPTIRKVSIHEAEVRELSEQCQTHAQRLQGLSQSALKAGHQMQAVDSLREEMARWDAERAAAQASTKDFLSQMRSELDRFRYNLEQKDSSMHGVQRTVDRLISEVKRLHGHEASLRGHVDEWLGQHGKILSSTNTDLEGKFIALESKLHQLADAVWGEETGLAKLTGDLGKTDAIVATLSEEIRSVHEAKSKIVDLQALQEQTHSHIQTADDNVRELRSMHENVVKDIKEHFRTATATVTAHNAAMLEEVHASHQNELDHWNKLRVDVIQFMKDTTSTMTRLEGEVGEARARNEEMIGSFQADLEALRTQRGRDKGNAEVEGTVMRERLSSLVASTASMERSMEHLCGVMWTLMQSERASSALDLQDNVDRARVALIGYAEKKADQLPHTAAKRPASERRSRGRVAGNGNAGATTPRSEDADGSPPMISVDQRCLSCSGQAQTVLSGFKMACLQYTPGPVSYGRETWTRSRLLETRQKLLEEANKALQEGPIRVPDKGTALHHVVGELAKGDATLKDPLTGTSARRTPTTTTPLSKQLGAAETTLLQPASARLPAREESPSPLGAGGPASLGGSLRMPPISARG